MSPQLMRERQAEIAERHGVMLEATRRLERGIFTRAAGIEEIYRAKAEARLPREIAMTPQERAIAQAQVAGFATGYRALADVLQLMDKRFLAQAMRRVAASLGTGTPYRLGEGEIDMETIRTCGRCHRACREDDRGAPAQGRGARPGGATGLRDPGRAGDPGPLEDGARSRTAGPLRARADRALSARGGRGAARGGLRRGQRPRARAAQGPRGGGGARRGRARRPDRGGRHDELRARPGLGGAGHGRGPGPGRPHARAGERGAAGGGARDGRPDHGGAPRARAGDGPCRDGRAAWAVGRTWRRAGARPCRTGRGAVSGRARGSQRAAGAGGPAPRRSARCARGGEDRAGAAGAVGADPERRRARRAQGRPARDPGGGAARSARPDRRDESVLELSHAETGEAIFAERASALQQDKAEALARQSRLEMPRGRELSRDAGDEIGL